MPIETGFGSIAVSVSYTDQYVYSDGISLPTGRTMANGSKACLVRDVRAYAAGRGASRSMSISFGPKTTAAFTVGSAGSAQNTGWHDLPDWLVQGGTARFQLNFNGSTYFGRGTDGDGHDSYGTSFGVLGGGFYWAQSPNAPTIASVSQTTTAGKVHMDFRGSTDDGGSGILSYKVQVAWNAAFTDHLTTIDTDTGQFDIDGLTVGQVHYFRVAATNDVTNAANTVGPWSNVKSIVAPGVPSAPRNLTAVQSTTALDTVYLDWDAPTSTAGGITGYDIWTGTLHLQSTMGTATALTMSNLVKNAHYTWRIQARNDFADDTGQRSPYSNNVEYNNWSTPSAPVLLTATPNASIAGRIDLSWGAPNDPGNGLTKYTVYYGSGQKVADVASTTTSYAVTGLTPGIAYSFYVVAWTAISQQIGTSGPASNTVSANAIGLPPAPTNVLASPSAAVPGRLIVTWTQPAGYTSFNVYEHAVAGDILIANVTTPRLVLDSVSPVGHSYVVAARNIVTDTTTPVSEGPKSAPSTPATPGQTASIPISVPVSNVTNTTYNGTYTITSVSATSISYTLNTSDQPSTVVPLGVGILTDSTNAALSGSHVITAVPSTTSFSYSQVASNIPTNTAVTGVTATDTTNQIFNGTFSVTAVDATNFTVSYAKTNADIASTVASGTVTNKSNTVYNGTNLIITGVPATNQLTYNKTNADLAETTASGTAIDTTNRDIMNATPDGRGSATVLSTPTYNTLTYSLNTALTQSSTSLSNPFGKAYRATSKASLEIKYRSGWAG